MIDKTIDKLSRKVLGKHGIVSVHPEGGRIIVGTTSNVRAVAPRVPHTIDGYKVWVIPANPIVAQRGIGDAIPTMNTDAVRAYMVGPSGTDWYLDAALVPHGIDPAAAVRVPAAVKQVLESTGANVATAKWGTAAGGDAGKIYVVWKPDKQYNAVDYANIASRLFKAAAEGLTSGARIVMVRYRVHRVWPMSDLYVYPTGEGIPASAPELAKNTLPGDLPPDAPSNESVFSADRTLATAVPIAAAVGGGLVLAGGLWWWLSRRSTRRMATNGRKRTRRNPGTFGAGDRVSDAWGFPGTVVETSSYGDDAYLVHFDKGHPYYSDRKVSVRRAGGSGLKPLRRNQGEKARAIPKPFAVLCGSDTIVWTGPSAAEADRAIVRTTIDGIPARIAGCYVAKFNRQTWKYERHGRGSSVSARQLAWNGRDPWHEIEGYAFEYTGPKGRWRTAPSDDWVESMVTVLAKEIGSRSIDGQKHTVLEDERGGVYAVVPQSLRQL